MRKKMENKKWNNTTTNRQREKENKITEPKAVCVHWEHENNVKIGAFSSFTSDFRVDRSTSQKRNTTMECEIRKKNYSFGSKKKHLV